MGRHGPRQRRRRTPGSDPARDSAPSSQAPTPPCTRITSKEALQGKVLHYDKNGEEHYNLIRPSSKSIRNSDPNASLYWLTRMMEAGEDGMHLARRLIRMASEDIGLADPFALRITLDAAEAFHQLGYPEGKLALVQAAVHSPAPPRATPSTPPLGQAIQDVRQTSAEPVPATCATRLPALMRQAGMAKAIATRTMIRLPRTR
ncbi:MAG: hypothetical protein R3E96_04090 [Planctomycetota bacterium]